MRRKLWHKTTKRKRMLRSRRVSQGGHDVPDDKLRERFRRTKMNLERSIKCLPHVLVYCNQNLAKPYELVELYENGQSLMNMRVE